MCGSVDGLSTSRNGLGCRLVRSTHHPTSTFLGTLTWLTPLTEPGLAPSWLCPEGGHATVPASLCVAIYMYSTTVLWATCLWVLFKFLLSLSLVNFRSGLIYFQSQTLTNLICMACDENVICDSNSSILVCDLVFCFFVFFSPSRGKLCRCDLHWGFTGLILTSLQFSDPGWTIPYLSW